MAFVEEVEALRQLVEDQKKRIEVLEAHFFRYDEADLNALSVQGGSWYVREKFGKGPVEQRTMVLNAVAHGITMGFRKKEEMMGIVKTSGEVKKEEKKNG